MTLEELRYFLMARGMEFDYMIDWLTEGAYFVWSVHRPGALLPVAWGKDLGEQAMIAHVLAIPQLHPHKPFVEALRDFGIELGAFA